MRLTVAEIAEACNGEVLSRSVGSPSGVNPSPSEEAVGLDETNTWVSGVTWDSRTVKPGNLYVALPGERVDGHDFIDAAVASGAAAVLVQRDGVHSEVPVIRVNDTARAFTEISAAWRNRLKGTVVGLTGSTGKTTTKNLVRDVLAAAGSVVATIANQNNELGVPNTLLSADAETAHVVVEMGMRGQGQIAELCDIAKPDWGLVTNAGESHIELLGSRQAIAHAKAELFEALPQGGIAFVNADDDFAAEMCAHAHLSDRGVRIVRFSGMGNRPCSGESDTFESNGPVVWAENVVLDENSCPSFTMCAAGFKAIGRESADGQANCALQLRGLHNVSNACSAAAVGLAAGLSLEQCCQALAASLPEHGRQQVLRSAAGVTVVDDSYNANPDSMRASLATFSAMSTAGKRIAVLGDMLELGDFSQECHERVGALAAAANLGALVCTGPLSRFMAEGAARAGMPASSVFTCDDAAEALEFARQLTEPGDAVLVKASHSVGLERVVEGLVD